MFNLIVLTFVFFTIVFVVLLGAAAFHKEKIVNICICILTWMALFFLFPYVARKYHVIKKRWIAILLMLVSPKQLVSDFKQKNIIVAKEYNKHDCTFFRPILIRP